ncbi:MAG: dephospho-CoA kinase [Bacteroidota bacterium]
MKIVGLTGGIGSGKTTVAGFFTELGVPVYIADVEAKKLTNSSPLIREELITLLGEDAYTEEGLDRAFVADRIFTDKELLKKVNAIIHPRVADHFKEWMEGQLAPYCIKEAAILFENGGYKKCDYTILVTAPVLVRIQRVLDRDNTSQLAIEDRISNQWDDEKKLPLADFHIENVDLEVTKSRVKELHELILKG